jgi:hypothetical protein
MLIEARLDRDFLFVAGSFVFSGVVSSILLDDLTIMMPLNPSRELLRDLSGVELCIFSCGCVLLVSLTLPVLEPLPMSILRLEDRERAKGEVVTNGLESGALLRIVLFSVLLSWQCASN